MAVYITAALALQSGLLFWRIFIVGYDYPYFYNAAASWLAGRSPYLQDAFVTPPPSVLPAALLYHFPVATSFAIYTAISVALMAFALWRFASALELSPINRFGLLVAAAAFVPTWLLVNGGNMDALMLAGLLLACSARSRITRALLLAGTIVLKVYSAVLLVVALRKRDFRLAALAALASLLLLLPFWRFWGESIHHLLFRTDRGFSAYNISPAQLFYFAFHRFGSLAWKLPYALCWLGAFAGVLRRNRDRSGPETLALYAPFMIAAPLVVYPYAAVIALPAFAMLLRISQDRPLRWHEWLGLAGFVLLDFHPEYALAFGSYTFAEFGNAKLAGSLAAAFGTTLLVICSALRAHAGPVPRALSATTRA